MFSTDLYVDLTKDWLSWPFLPIYVCHWLYIFCYRIFCFIL